MAAENKREGGGAAAFDRSTQQGDEAIDAAVFPKYPIASWEVIGSPRLAFPVVSVSESGGNRLVERERPYRDGAKLDDTGSKAKRWELTVLFHNSIEEPGLEVNGGQALYPNTLNSLIDTFELHRTGDLVVPTRGLVRARAAEYRRQEDADNPDSATVTFTFVEDNEDSVDIASFTAPTANADAARLGEQTTFDAQSIGLDSLSLADLNEFAAGLESLANAPGDLLVDLDSQAAIVIGAVNRVAAAFSHPSQEGRDLLDDPESSRTHRKLERLKQIASDSEARSSRGRPRTTTVVVSEDSSLFRVSAALKQSFDDLLVINPRLVNPLFIPAGTPINVFADGSQT
jgi:prophage DNA circulation protein